MDDVIRRLEFVIQICRLQIQRERDKIMTPKMAGALEALKKLQSAGDDVADKISKRITEVTMPALLNAEKSAHGTIDKMHSVVDDIEEFAGALKSSNGGDPLDGSAKSLDTIVQLPPRSSEVAGR